MNAWQRVDLSARVHTSTEKGMDCQRPILVTGSPRSGTTFLATMLSLPREIGYVQEPFNCALGLEGQDLYFPYLFDGMPDEARYRQLVEALLNGKASFRRLPVRDAPTLWRGLGRLLFRSGSNWTYLQARLDPRVDRFLLKAPFACLAADYLQRHYGLETIVLVRHPAAFITSMMRLGFPSHLEDLARQETLVQDHLSDLLSGVQCERLPRIEQLALLWLCLYTVVASFLSENSKLLLVRHEDVSRDPHRWLSDLYERLGLVYTASVRGAVETYTSPDNPVDPTSNLPHVLRRNSRANVGRWKGVLSSAQIAAVKTITYPLARQYYDDETWE